MVKSAQNGQNRYEVKNKKLSYLLGRSVRILIFVVLKCPESTRSWGMLGFSGAFFDPLWSSSTTVRMQHDSSVGQHWQALLFLFSVIWKSASACAGPWKAVNWKCFGVGKCPGVGTHGLHINKALLSQCHPWLLNCRF